MPEQSGVFHENYASDTQLRPTTMQRVRILATFALLFAAPFILGQTEIRLINQVMIASIGAIGLNILTGFTGQISLGQGAFLAIGAYTCGLLIVPMEGAQNIDFPVLFDWAEPAIRALAGWAAPWPIALLLGAFVTAIIGGFFGLPSLRLKGLYLAVATLAAQQIVEWTIKRWDPIDGELDGRTTDALSIPRNLLVDWNYVEENARLFAVLTVIAIVVVLGILWWMHRHFSAQNALLYQIASYAVGFIVLMVLGNTFFILIDPNANISAVYAGNATWQLNANEYSFYWFVMPLTIIVAIAATNLFRTHIGRAFIAIRDQDIAAEVMGVNIFRYKVLAFMVSSFVVGLAGGLLALHSTAISFERFTISISIEYLAMIIIGGLGSVSGSIYGAAFIVILPELLRSIGRSLTGTDPAAQREFNRILPFAQQGVFGAVIVLTLIVESGGIRKLWQNFKDYFRLWPFNY